MHGKWVRQRKTEWERDRSLGKKIQRDLKTESWLLSAMRKHSGIPGKAGSQGKRTQTEKTSHAGCYWTSKIWTLGTDKQTDHIWAHTTLQLNLVLEHSGAETGWDPLLRGMHLDNTSPPAKKMQRNDVGLKRTLCMSSWGKFWTKKKRDQKTQLSLLKSLEQKQGVGSKSRVLGHGPLHTPPPKVWANHLSHPSSLTPGHTSTPHKEQACPASERTSKQRSLLFSPLCPVLRQGPQ